MLVKSMGRSRLMILLSCLGAIACLGVRDAGDVGARSQDAGISQSIKNDAGQSSELASLRIDDPVYYAEGQAKVTITAGQGGYYQLNERGVDGRKRAVWSSRLDAGAVEVVTSTVRGGAGQHVFELAFSEAKASAQGELVSRSPFQVRGPMWSRLEAIQFKLGRGLELSSNKKVLQVGDNLVLTMNLPKRGHLLVVSVDARDRVEVIFPNPLATQDVVKAGSLRVPGVDAGYDLPAAPPVGDVQILAFLSDAPILKPRVADNTSLVLGESEVATLEAACRPVKQKYPPIALGRVDVEIRDNNSDESTVPSVQ